MDSTLPLHKILAHLTEYTLSDKESIKIFMTCLSSMNSVPSSCSKPSMLSRTLTLFFQFLSVADSTKTGRIDCIRVEGGRTCVNSWKVLNMFILTSAQSSLRRCKNNSRIYSFVFFLSNTGARLSKLSAKAAF